MKVLAALLMFVTMGVLAKAQTTTARPATAPVPAVQVMGDIFRSNGVKNSPFSADAISESIQVLPDGNRIVRTSTSKLYRNSEGRFRNETTGGTGGMLGSFYSFGDGVSVFSPMGGSFSLDTDAKVARVFDSFGGQAISMAAPLAAMKAIEPIKISEAVRAEIESAKRGQGGTVEAKDLSPAARAEIEALKANADQFKQSVEAYRVDADKMKQAAEELRAVAVQSASTVAGSAMFAPAARHKWETRTEDLGEQNIEGVSARGTRTITSIPAGAIGNERAIETVYEKWYSPDLQMVIYSKHSDPRFGEQTYRMTNINRTEPDPSLFQVPSGYKKVSGGQGGAYTVTTTSKAQQVEYAASKSAQSGVKKTRPQQN